MKIDVLVTAPPYAAYLEEAAAHELVSGLRLNTVMPLKDGPAEAIERLTKFGKPVWVDLKGRQLRVVGAAIPPFTEIQLSHPISVDTPVDAFFADGTEHARVAAVDGERVILESGPRRLIGPGESVNIVDPSLQIHGTLTETDKAYLGAMQEHGLSKVMLSYVEDPSDVEEVGALLPGAEVILKIETMKGVAFAREHGNKHGRLCAARGDLFIEVLQPHKIVPALKEIIQADSESIVASRVLDSLAHHPVPSSADISDIALLLSMGYRTFMLGDAVCLRRESVLAALNLLTEIALGMKGKF
ncbi:MAG: pyruvate kinase [Chloroflexota bacterium]